MNVSSISEEALTPELDALITALPKAELHIHLEGSIRPKTLLLLAQRNGIDLGYTDEDSLRAKYSYQDFRHFIKLYGVLTSVLRQPEDFKLITEELGLEAAKQGTLYLEVTFSAAIHHRNKGIPFDEMMEAIAAGAKVIRQQVGVEMRFILDHVRGYPLDYCQRTAEWCVEGRDSGIVALGLAGYEPDWPASLYAQSIHWVQSHGLPFVPHTGEAVGPEGIWDALQFNPPRIGHGFRAVEDPILVETLRDRKIALEICPTSNICTGCVSRWEDHPLRKLWDAGVLVTINSDDPPMFNTCAGYLGHPFWKKQLGSDLLVPICLQERSGTGRIRESACLSYVDTFLFAKEKPVFPVLIPLRHRITLCFHALSDGIIRWMKPRSTSLLLGTIADLAKGKSELLVENALLRQQLIILRRQVKRPACKNSDRFLLLFLARMVRTWKQALFIVQPETLLRWHRGLFRLFWKHKSKAHARKPRLSPETISLIKEMAANNRFWAAERIRGELLKLDIRVSKRTIQKYMRRVRPKRARGQNWKMFLRNHAAEVWACDFLQVPDLFFRPLFAFFIIEQKSRKVIHMNVTRSPTDLWVAQQLREATPYGQTPKYLIRDNDRKFGSNFARVATTSGINVLRTPYRTPQANAVCERFLGSVRRECLDHFLILHEKQLTRLLKAYVVYFNQARPHQGLGQRIPDPPVLSASPPNPPNKVFAVPVLGGLHHDYQRAA